MIQRSSMSVVLLMAACSQVCGAFQIAAVPVDDLVRAGHWKRARAALENTSASDAHTLFLRARVEYAFRDYKRALPLAERAIALNPEDAEAHLLLGQIHGQIATTAHFLSQVKLVKNVKREFEQALALDPRNVDVLLALVEFYLRAPGIVGGDKNKARQFAQELSEINPARGQIAKALIAQYAKDVASARRAYENIAADPHADSFALVRAGEWLLSDPIDDQSALHCARRVMDSDPASGLGYGIAAAALAHEKRWEELDELLHDTVIASADDLRAYFAAAQMMLRDHQRLERAESYVREYIRHEPEAGAPKINEAEALLQRIAAAERENRS